MHKLLEYRVTSCQLTLHLEEKIKCYMTAIEKKHVILHLYAHIKIYETAIREVVIILLIYMKVRKYILLGLK
jgi:hypothetical protein